MSAMVFFRGEMSGRGQMSYIFGFFGVGRAWPVRRGAVHRDGRTCGGHRRASVDRARLRVEVVFAAECLPREIVAGDRRPAPAVARPTELTRNTRRGHRQCADRGEIGRYRYCLEQSTYIVPGGPKNEQLQLTACIFKTPENNRFGTLQRRPILHSVHVCQLNFHQRK